MELVSLDVVTIGCAARAASAVALVGPADGVPVPVVSTTPARPPPAEAAANTHADQWSDHWYQCFNYQRFTEMLTTGTNHHTSSILRSSDNFLEVCKRIIKLSVVWRIKVCFHYCTFHVGMWSLNVWYFKNDHVLWRVQQSGCTFKRPITPR